MLALRCEPRPREAWRSPGLWIEKAARTLLLDEEILAHLPRVCLRTILRIFYRQSRWKIGRIFERRRYAKEFGPPRIFKIPRGRDCGTRRMHDSAQPRPALQQSTVANSKRAKWAAKLRQVKFVALRCVSGIGFKVFAALELYCDTDGYCWPLVETIQKLIGIDRRRSIFKGLAELRGSRPD